MTFKDATIASFASFVIRNFSVHCNVRSMTKRLNRKQFVAKNTVGTVLQIRGPKQNATSLILDTIIVKSTMGSPTAVARMPFDHLL